METTIDNDASLAELVEQNPARARVFEDRNLDYCCGGNQSLEQACHQADLSIDEVRDALESVDKRSDNDGPDQFDSPVELVDFIVEHHHDFLRDELGSLGDLVDKVAGVHGDTHPELEDVAEAFERLTRELPRHVSEEEQILFPTIRRLDEDSASDAETRTARAVLDRLEEDHDETAHLLERIRRLTEDFTVPSDACPSYETMLARLENLEADIHLHVHRENNVLFEKVRRHIDG